MTFNIGTDFVTVVPEENIEAFVKATDSRVIGHVEAGDGVLIHGPDL